MTKDYDEDRWDPYAFQAELDLFIPSVPIAHSKSYKSTFSDPKFFRNDPQFAKYGLGALPPPLTQQSRVRNDPTLRKLVHKKLDTKTESTIQQDEEEEDEGRTKSISMRERKSSVEQLTCVEARHSISSQKSESRESALSLHSSPVSPASKALKSGLSPSLHSNIPRPKRSPVEPLLFSNKKPKLAQYTRRVRDEEFVEEGLGDGVEEVDGEEKAIVLRDMELKILQKGR